MSINELALALIGLGHLFGAVLLDLQRDVRLEIVGAARKLAELIGGATITDIDAYHDSVPNEPKARAEI